MIIKKLLLFSIFFFLFLWTAQLNKSFAQTSNCNDFNNPIECNQKISCFWYAGYQYPDRVEDEKCVSKNSGTRGVVCLDRPVKDSDSYCYYDMSCNPVRSKCFKTTYQSPPAPTKTPTPTSPSPSANTGIAEITINLKAPASLTFEKLDVGFTNKDTKEHYFQGTFKNNSNVYRITRIVPIGIYSTSAALYDAGSGNPKAAIESLGTIVVKEGSDNDQEYDWILTEDQLKTTPTPTTQASSTPDGKPVLKETETPKNATPPPSGTKGYCADGSRGNAKPVNGGSCDIKNETGYNAAFDGYCHETFGSPSDFFFSCGGSGTIPGNGTPGAGSGTPTKPQFPCDGHGSVIGYEGESCGGNKWNADDATKGTFCKLEYTDSYKCSDGTTHHFAPTFPAGKSPCENTPWCKTATTATPSPVTKSGPTQGMTCIPTTKDPANPGLGNCQAGLNLQCVDLAYNGFYTCQYIDGKAPIPTPGPANNCSATNIGNWGLGCPCVNGGCNSNLNCYPGADKGSLTSGTSYCAPTSQYWCPAQGVVVSSPTQCTGSAPTTPTPTPNKDYQVDCPDDGQNACILGISCPNGYQQNGIGFGGTNGNQVCTEFEGGLQSTCCRRIAGSSSPIVTSAPTPTPVTSTVNTCPNSFTEQCQQEPTSNGCLAGWNPSGKTCTSPAVCCLKSTTSTTTPACPNSSTEQCQQEPTSSGCLAGWNPSGKTCTSPAVCCLKN